MKDQTDIFYKAYITRDHRFDGKFICAVKTTGIYCRPICPAKPKRENVEFYLHAFQAENAGYRPCLRCRPESAPSSGAWIGTNAIVKRALTLIQTQLTHDKDEEEFAALLGVSARHLRRLFEAELGRTPKQIADLHRLNFSRKLIVETNLPMTEIAHSSGFKSLRRFNEAFKERFTRTPSEIRRLKSSAQDSAFILRLSYRPPYDFTSLLEFFRNHLLEGLETVSDSSYERIFKIDSTIGAVSVTQDSHSHELVVAITTTNSQSLFTIVQRVRDLFDTDSDPLVLETAFKSCKMMSKLLKKHQGLRLPRGWDPFETAISAILGQLVSVSQARSLVRELISNYGEEVKHPLTGKAAYLFPSPEVLASSTLSRVRTTEKRRETIRAFAKMYLAGTLKLDSTQNMQDLRKLLRSINGIGPWTAEYIALRAIGDTDAFPETDLIIKRVLKKFGTLDPEKMRPWRGYMAFYLWKEFAWRKI